MNKLLHDVIVRQFNWGANATLLALFCLLGANSGQAQSPTRQPESRQPLGFWHQSGVWNNPTTRVTIGYQLGSEMLMDRLLTTEDIRYMAQSKRLRPLAVEKLSLTGPLEPMVDTAVKPASFETNAQGIGLQPLRPIQQDHDHGHTHLVPSSDPSDSENPDEHTTESDSTMASVPLLIGGIPWLVPAALMPRSIESIQKQIDKFRSATTNDEDIGPDRQRGRLELLDAASDWVLKFQHDIACQGEFEDHLQSYPHEIERLSEQLAHATSDVEPELRGLESVEAFQSQLQKCREDLAHKQTELGVNEKAKAQFSLRNTLVSEERTNAQERQKRIDRTIEQLAAEIDDIDHQISLLVQNAKKQATRVELLKLRAESKRKELRGQLLQLKSDLIARELRQLREVIPKWEDALADFRRHQVKRRVAAARQAALKAHPILREIAARNEELTKIEVQIHEKLESIQKELTKVSATHNALKSRFESIKTDIKLADVNYVNGVRLVELRRDLAPVGESWVRIRQLELEKQDVSAKLVEFKKERDELADPLQLVEKHVGSSHSEETRTMALEFYMTQRKYLEIVLDDFREYQEQQTKVSTSLQLMVDQLTETRNYIDKKALWIRSAEPIGLADINSIQMGAVAFFAPEKWTQMVLGVKTRMIGRPFESGIALLGFFALFVFTRRLRANMN